MGSWREQYLWNKCKRADLYGTGARLNVPKKTNITPAEIYYKKLKANKRFTQLNGQTTWSLSLNNDGQYYRRYYRYQTRTTPSEWYVYNGDGDRKALINLPEYDSLRCRVFLHILWVPKELEHKGIGTEVMRELMAMTDIVDNMCKNEEAYEGKYISCGSFTLTLCPNSFVIRENHWDIEAIAAGTDDIDWTAKPGSESKNAPDFHMMDETNAYLPKEERRLSLQDLRAFYCDKLGFIPCSELAFNEWFDFDSGRMKREMNISGRSAAHQRWPLLYPAENLSVWEKEDDS